MKSRLSKLDRELAVMRAEQGKKSAPVPAAEKKLPQESTMQIDTQVSTPNPVSQIVVGEHPADTPPPTAVNNKVPDKIPVEEHGATPEQVVAQKTGASEEKRPENVAKEPILAKEEEQEKSAAAPSSADEKTEQPSGVQLVEHEKLTTEAAVSVAQEKAAKPSPENIPSAAGDEKTAVFPVQTETPPVEPVEIRPEQRKHRVPPLMRIVPNAEAAKSGLMGNPELQPPTVPPTSSTFSYLVKDGETAYDIAERFYGDRKYYPVLMEQNPHIFLGFIRRNSIVRLFADRRAAAAFYERRIEHQDGLMLWKYTVLPGETWRSIYARFFLPRYSGMVFYGDQNIAPGKTVRIILR